MRENSIDKMEAGRELDALVAKWMGWRQEYARRITGEMDPMWNEPEYLLPPGGDEAEKVPAYSIDIAAAWKVVKKLYSPDASITLETGTRNGESVWWLLRICAGRHQ